MNKLLLPPGVSESPVSLPKRHSLLIGAVGFVLGIAVTTAWFSSVDLKMVENPISVSTSTPTSGLSEHAFGDLLSVHDQAAGSQVYVDSVNIPAPGVWVVVAEMRGDDLGNILGAARVLSPTKGLSVDLQRATVPGRTYAVVLYREDGDGVFNYQADSVYVDWNSTKRVIALFNTTQ